ncbi:hypothetical protein ACFQ0B_25235 [Nonomuraea thailandensis]
MAARVLTGDGHAGKVYELTGPASMTQAEQVSVLGTVLGRPLRFEELDAGPVREQLGRFMDPAFVNALFDLMEATVGKPAPVSSLVEDLTGGPPARTRSGPPTTGPTSADRHVPALGNPQHRQTAALHDPGTAHTAAPRTPAPPTLAAP